MAYELIKVSELPELTTPSDPNVLPIQDGDYLKRISFENLKEAATGDVADDLAAEVTARESAVSGEATARGNADTAILADLASPYSASSTYAVGDYCTKDGQLYRCTTAITTAEAWTSGHWSAVALGDDTSDLRSALNDIDDTIYTEGEPPAIIWEQGKYDASSGASGTLNTRIRTQNDFGVWNGVTSVAAKDDYQFMAHAWDSSGTYVGVWNGTAFVTSGYFITAVDCTAYPTYKYKLTVKKGTAGTTELSPSDADNMVSFTLAPQKTANFPVIHDSKNIGFEWESGGINLDTGEDQTVTGRLRSQYVPVTEAETYAFNVAESNNTYAEYVFYYTADKTPILIDTDNNRYWVRLSYGFFPKTIEIPSGKNIAFLRMMVAATAFDYYHGQAEKNSFATTFRSRNQRETDNKEYPNNINGYLGKRILLFGDSITAQNNWPRWFETSVKPVTLYNYAVGGATWCDPTSGIIYDGTSGTYNVIGNQIQRAVNNNLVNIDCVIILAGTNDTNVTFPTDEDIEEAFFDSSMNPIALADVDRTTWQGAMRWSLETLILRYPQAKFFVCAPVQRAYKTTEPILSLYSTIKGKGDTIAKMARRMGVEFVDTMQCGISSQRAVDFADGLHPWQRTSEKIARYIIARYMAHFCQN